MKTNQVFFLGISFFKACSHTEAYAQHKSSLTVEVPLDSNSVLPLQTIRATHLKHVQYLDRP